MKLLPPVAVAPTLMTLGNLTCGFLAIAVGAGGSRGIASACGLILLAMVFDALDGFVARAMAATTEFGAKLDSLSDLVSFGVAPAFVLVQICSTSEVDYSEAIWAVAAVYVCCTALRLARFEVESNPAHDGASFSGLPSPAAAAMIASMGLLATEPATTAGVTYLRMEVLLAALSGGMALLMISRVQYPHLARWAAESRGGLPQIVGMLLVIAGLVLFRQSALPLLAIAYVMAPPVGAVGKWLRCRYNRGSV